jgi:hypothetical protein
MPASDKDRQSFLGQQALVRAIVDASEELKATQKL